MGHGAWGIGHRASGTGKTITYYLLPMPIAHCPIPNSLFLIHRKDIYR
ncbi:MAG: hypothetical protein KME31_11830 [Tolypothrix carrinoi HA7290-LM1]|nr:hypothetical protein [Tolypothrix carrinoi HA7290-LM1]